MKSRRLLASILTIPLSVAIAFSMSDLSVRADPPIGGGPEGNGGVSPTPTLPPWFPTPFGDPNPQCDVYMFRLFHTSRFSNIFDFRVDQVEWNGKKLLAFKPNAVFTPGSALAGASGTDRALWQIAAGLTGNIAANLNNWFANAIRNRYTEYHLNEQYNDPNGFADALDDKILTDWWGYVCQNAPDNFGNYIGGRAALCPAVSQGYVQAKSREILNVNGTINGNNFVETYPLDANGVPLPYASVTDLLAAGKKLCDAGSAFVMQTPISLIMDESSDIDSSATLTQFPLDPNKKGDWYIWKASEKAPLLVFDPEHTGTITTASQLFGNWAFGGKRVAMASSDMQGLSGTSTWKDGFEALESLDADGDSEVSGDELDPLALWFDKNQNGISEPGEVRSLREEKITRLFFKVERNGSNTADLVLKRGFEREVDGKSVFGRSVDWVSPNSPTPLGMISKLPMVPPAVPGPSVQAMSSESGGISASDDVSAFSTTRSTSNLRGAWKWKIDGDPSGAASGNMFIKANKTGGLSGLNFALLAVPTLESPLPNVAGFMQVATFDVDVRNDGNAEFLTMAPGGTILRSAVSLSDDNSKLNGKTRTSVRINGREISISYTWTAERIPMPEKAANLKGSKRLVRAR